MNVASDTASNVHRGRLMVMMVGVSRSYTTYIYVV